MKQRLPLTFGSWLSDKGPPRQGVRKSVQVDAPWRHMTVSNVEVTDSVITFSLSGQMSMGSAPIISLLIRSSQKLGLTVKVDMTDVTNVDPEVRTYLLAWQMEGAALSGPSHLALDSCSMCGGLSSTLDEAYDFNPHAANGTACAAASHITNHR